jgi:hypothetical protein
MHSSIAAGTPASRFEHHPGWQFPSGHFMDESGICPADAVGRNEDDNLENENVSGGQAFPDAGPDAGKHPREKQPEMPTPSSPDTLDQPNPPTADPDYRQQPPETVPHDPHKAYAPTDPSPTVPQPEIIDDHAEELPADCPVAPPPGGFVIRENIK